MGHVTNTSGGHAFRRDLDSCRPIGTFWHAHEVSAAPTFKEHNLRMVARMLQETRHAC